VQIKINNKVFTFPSSLSEMTLGQRIAFQQEHGNLLDAMLTSILEMPEGPEKQLEVMHFQFEKMFRTFSFFSGFTVEELKASEFIEEIASIYYANVAQVMEHEAQIELQPSYQFMGEEWVIHPPELKQGSEMTFGEFIDAKQIIKNLIDLGASKWEQLVCLAAIYFRKKGEPYQASFMYEGSERQELMKQLPMDIALAVGFFLSSSVNLYLNTLQFSSRAVSDQMAVSVQPTMSAMAG
jgi:hypothetical protein